MQCELSFAASAEPGRATGVNTAMTLDITIRRAERDVPALGRLGAQP